MLSKIAFRNIFRQKRRSLLTALTMMTAYVLLSLSLAISDGSYSHMIRIFTEDHSGHVQLHRGDFLERPQLTKTLPIRNQFAQALQQYMRDEKAIRSYTRRIKNSALGYAHDKALPVQVIGIDPEAEARTSKLALKVKEGQYLAAQYAGSPAPVMVGMGLAEKMKLKVGDELVLISQGADGSVANDIFKVSALVGSKDSYEAQNVYMHLEAAQEFFMLSKRFHEMVFLLNHFNQAKRIAKELNRQFVEFTLTASPWQEIEKDFYQAMQMDVKGNYITLFILTLISAIGILNAVLMTILERTREYGVMLATGSRPRQVFAIIVLETLFLALMSCAGGLVVGSGLNFWLQETGISLQTPIDFGGLPFSTIYGEVSMRTMFVPGAVVLITAGFVSFWPALRACRMQPITALRGS